MSTSVLVDNEVCNACYWAARVVRNTRQRLETTLLGSHRESAHHRRRPVFASYRWDVRGVGATASAFSPVVRLAPIIAHAARSNPTANE